MKKASGECPKCHNNDQAFEEASMGSVHICTFGGGRYSVDTMYMYIKHVYLCTQHLVSCSYIL